MKILYAEDDISARENFLEILQLSDYEILAATNGEEAKKLYDLHKPEFIITDINMPFCNGIELTNYIKAQNEDAFVVITTAHNENNFLLQAIEAGVDKFLLKPINFEDISKLLRDYIPLVEAKIHLQNEQKNLKHIHEILWESKLTGLCIIDKDKKIIKHNQLLKEYIGVEELIGLDINKYLETIPHETNILIREVQNEFVFSMYLLSKDGKKTPYVIAKENYTLEDGSLVSLLRFHNVEDEVEAKKEIQKQNQFLIQQSKMATMGQMLENIAHQWRQPLNALSLQISNFINATEPHCPKVEELYKFEEGCNTQIQYMSSTIDDFRTFFKPDMQKVLFSPLKSLKKTIQLIETSFYKENIHLKTKINPEFEGLKCLGYPSGYQQVILNLFSNAKDAIINSNLENNRKIESWFEVDALHMILHISDTGGGVPEEIKEQIFEPYFSTKGADRGTGIGLYMAKMIVEKQMKGSLTVINNNKGAVFSITLPIAKEQ